MDLWIWWSFTLLYGIKFNWDKKDKSEDPSNLISIEEDDDVIEISKHESEDDGKIDYEVLAN